MLTITSVALSQTCASILNLPKLSCGTRSAELLGMQPGDTDSKYYKQLVADATEQGLIPEKGTEDHRCWIYRDAYQWTFCRHCGEPKPPRAHFDHVTERLVLNMDHYWYGKSWSILILNCVPHLCMHSAAVLGCSTLLAMATITSCAPYCWLLPMFTNFVIGQFWRTLLYASIFSARLTAATFRVLGDARSCKQIGEAGVKSVITLQSIGIGASYCTQVTFLLLNVYRRYNGGSDPLVLLARVLDELWADYNRVLRQFRRAALQSPAQCCSCRSSMSKKPVRTLGLLRVRSI